MQNSFYISIFFGIFLCVSCSSRVSPNSQIYEYHPYHQIKIKIFFKTLFLSMIKKFYLCLYTKYALRILYNDYGNKQQ